MRNWIGSLLFHIFIGKEGEDMMAMLWAQKIMSADTIEEAHALYNRVPRLLKEQVRELLVDSGCDQLIVEE